MRENGQKILNLSYIGTDEKEEESFQEKMEAMGIKNQSDIFMTPFYPHLKKEIKQSWDRLFINHQNEGETKRGALWEIRKEWLKSGVTER